MQVFYFILWLIIFEGLLVLCLFMENHFKRHARKQALQHKKELSSALRCRG